MAGHGSGLATNGSTKQPVAPGWPLANPTKTNYNKDQSDIAGSLPIPEHQHCTLNVKADELETAATNQAEDAIAKIIRQA